MTAPVSRFAKLAEWLSWLETNHPKAIDLGLERVALVAQRLGLVKPEATLITVAGTNGKGSCIAALEALLIANGKHVACYTSPHIQKYNERMTVQGIQALDDEICEAFTAIDSARGDISLTYFEFGTLAAFFIFQKHELDYWLLEIGLGGRLDAVNILPPDLAIITSVDLDHQAWLGSTRERISAEKCGILRENTPCVCADRNPTANMLAVFEALNTPLFLIGRDFDYNPASKSLYATERDGGKIKHNLDPFNLPADSVAAAVQAMIYFSKTPELAPAIEGLTLTGRFEIITHKNITWVLDVAHNPAATRLLAKTLNQRLGGAHYAVVAMMADKDIEGCIQPLLPLVDKWLVAEIPGSSRSAAKERIKTYLDSLSKEASNRKSSEPLDVSVCDSVALSLNSVIERHCSDYGADEAPTVVLVYGSFLTVAAAKHFLDSKVFKNG